VGIGAKVERVISGRSESNGFFVRFLDGLSMVYGFAVKMRAVLYNKNILKSGRLSCRVVSVGNITAGGTGKTPVTMHVAQLLRDAGYSTVVISRGYKGRAENCGGIVSDTDTVLMGPEDSGDEPFMMAARLPGVPVLVGKDRLAMGRLAMKRFSPDVIVLDDGFQHRRLFRDMDIVLIDETSFRADMRLLPRGPLREPVSALGRADLIVLTRSSGPSTPAIEILAGLAPGKPVFRSSHAPYVCGVFKDGAFAAGADQADDPSGMSRSFELLKKANVFVFSGIANNQAFQDMVAGMARAVVGEMAFPDHHHYTDADMNAIVGQAEKRSADFLVTTEKDYVKLNGKRIGSIGLVVIGIDMSFQGQETAFAQCIQNMIAGKPHE